MSKQLYEEAIADLKKVKEIAEDNAKRAVVEAVAPRIRELIEKELLGESLDEEETLDEVETNPNEPKEKPLLKGAISTPADATVETVPFAELTGDVGEPSAHDALETRLHYVEQMLEKLMDEKDDSVMESVGAALSRLNDEIGEIYGHVQENVVDPAARLGYGLKLRNCLEKIEKLQETTMKKNLLGEEKVRIELDLPGIDLGSMEDAAVELVLDEEGEEEAGEEMEMEPEAGEEKPAEEEAPEAGEEPAAEEPAAEEEGLLEISDLSDDSVVEIDESMLRNEIALMKILREADESDNSEEGHAPAAKEFDDFGGAKEEGEALEMDLSEAYGMDEDVYEMVDAKPGMEEYSMDEVDHEGMDLDEAELDEMMKQYMAEKEETKVSDTTNPAGDKSAEGTAAAAATPDKKPANEEKHDKSHGKMLEDDMLEIVDDANESYLEEMETMTQAKDEGEYNTKYKNVQTRNESVREEMANELELQESLRKRASQLKKIYEAAKKVASGAKTLIERKEASSHTSEIKAQYAKTAEKYNASVARFNKLSQSLSEGAVKGAVSNSGAQSGASADQIDTLSKKLAETNLFNAKLLFTNKLLQTESLTARQKAQVIEQLDAAETIREAKLVYESLAKTMVKPRKTVTESRVLGSSSQATRPASTQTLSEGVESERWARLAGIK